MTLAEYSLAELIAEIELRSVKVINPTHCKIQIIIDSENATTVADTTKKVILV